MTEYWFNPADKHASISLSAANHVATANPGSSWVSARCFPAIIGKKYFEFVCTTYTGQAMFGVAALAAALTTHIGVSAVGWGYNAYDGNKFNNGSGSAFGSTFAAGDIIGVHVDEPAGKMWLAKNNVCPGGGDPATGANPAFDNLAGQTVYPAISAYSNGTVITAGMISEDLAYAPAAGFTPFSSSLRAMLQQKYDLQPYLVRAILDQPYTLYARLTAILDQVYGLRMLQTLIQPYSDAARLRATLDQRYKDAAKLRRTLDMKYGDSPKYRSALDQLCNLQAGLRAICDQPYAIAEGKVRAILDQVANLQDKDLVRTTLDMLYVLAAGEALVQRFDIRVTCDGVEHTSMSNINIEQDGSSTVQFAKGGDLQLYCRAEYLQYKEFQSVVEITVNGRTYQLLAGMPQVSRQPGQDVFVVPLTSPTLLLDSPHSRLASQAFSGMASAMVEAIADPVTVSWQLVDWFIPPGRLAVNEGDSAISVIRRIVEAVGGIIQTGPDGTLICRPEYPVSVDKWETVTPDYYLTDQDDFFQIDFTPEQRPGYNKVNVSDSQLSTTGLTMEPTTISEYEAEYRIYQVPWNGLVKINLLHSGDPGRVTVVADGVVIETVSEQIEIVGGSGRTAKPVFSLDNWDYNETELGDVTALEDGTVTTATAGNSLLTITYRTRCWLFSVIDYTPESVQFFPEEVAI